MTASTNRGRHVLHVERLWGGLVSIQLVAHDEATEPALEPARAALVRWLQHADDVVSPYRADSDLSRWRNREAALADLAPEVAEVVDLAVVAELRTAGAFEPEWSGGRPDPTGLLKGWLVDRAVAIAGQEGVRDLQIIAGGDVRTRGRRPDGAPWRVAIENPVGGEGLLDVVSGHGLCLATSSVWQSGDPILRYGAPAEGVLSVTVLADSLARADAYSTAAFAAGAVAPWLLSGLESEGCQSLVLLDDRRVWASSAWPGEQPRSE